MLVRPVTKYSSMPLHNGSMSDGNPPIKDNVYVLFLQFFVFQFLSLISLLAKTQSVYPIKEHFVSPLRSVIAGWNCTSLHLLISHAGQLEIPRNGCKIWMESTMARRRGNVRKNNPPKKDTTITLNWQEWSKKEVAYKLQSPRQKPRKSLAWNGGKLAKKTKIAAMGWTATK